MEKENTNIIKVPLSRYLFAFLIAVLIFIIVFSISYGFSYLNYQDIHSNQNIIQEYISDLDNIIAQKNCSENLLYEASDRLDRVGAQLSLLETRFGKNDWRVIEQKSFYSELEYRHFKIVDKLNEQCGRDFVTILFFYSNIGDRKEEGESVGFILGTLKNKYPERAMIYSFDYNLDTETIYTLRENYKVSGIPAVIVNKNESVVVNSIDDIEPYLN